MKHLVIILSVLSMTSGIAVAQQRKQDDLPKEEIVTGAGCVEAGVETNCIVLKDRKTGDLYNLYFEPGKAPKLGAGITFQGRTRSGATICMQGKPVSVLKWTANEQLCQLPKATVKADSEKK